LTPIMFIDVVGCNAKLVNTTGCVARSDGSYWLRSYPTK